MTEARRARWALAGIALTALLARLAILPWFAAAEPHIYDERDYVRLAESLAQHGEFALRGERTVMRPPLYPAVASLVYRVAGAGNHQAVRLLQILLNVCLVPLVYALGRRLYGRDTGVWAAALAVFYPSLWGHDYLLLTEVLFTTLLVAGAVALVEYAAHPRAAMLAAAGVALGLAALTRSSMTFFPLFLALAVFGVGEGTPAQRRRVVLGFLAVFAVTLAPWIARNSLLLGRLSPIDSLAGVTAARFSPLRPLAPESPDPWSRLMQQQSWRELQRPHKSGQRFPPAGSEEAAPSTTTGPAVPAEPTAGTGAESAVPPATPGAGAARGGGGRDSRASPEVEWRERVTRTLAKLAWNTTGFWRIDRELVGAAVRGWLGPIPRPAVLAIAMLVVGYYAALAVAAAAGLALRPPQDRLQLWLVLALVATLFGVHALSVGHSRYHIPLMPLLAVFAARLVTSRGEPAPRRRRAGAAVLVALLVGSWIAWFVRDDLGDIRERLQPRKRSAAVELRQGAAETGILSGGVTASALGRR